MAIAYWAVGDDNAALEYVERAQRAFGGFRGRTEVSCWRYIKVDVRAFGEDLGEIRTLIKKPGSVVPKFMVVKGNGSAEA